MSHRLNIHIGTHFIIMKELCDGIIDLQFKCIADYMDAIKVLKEYQCRYSTFQANESEYHHIFTNKIGIATLTKYFN